MAVGLIMLAGGKSKRMGTNKALLPIEGKPNIAKIKETLEASFANVILVTNDQDLFQWLGVPMVSDQYPGKGPLAGIHAGLTASSCEINLVVACDMPFVSATLGRYLADVSHEVDAVVPRWNGQLHPLFAIYRQTCHAHIEYCLTRRNLRLVDFLHRLKVRYVEEVELSEVISSGDPFTNMNTPDEYQKVLEKLKER